MLAVTVALVESSKLGKRLLILVIGKIQEIDGSTDRYSTVFPYLSYLHNSNFDSQVIDEDEDGLVTFREFARGLGIICKGELQDRMQFMYRMHVPPAVCNDAADLSDEESLDSCMELTESGSAEVSASQSRDQRQSHDQYGSGSLSAEEIPVSISPKTKEGDERRTDEDNVKRVTEIPPMSQVKKRKYLQKLALQNFPLKKGIRVSSNNSTFVLTLFLCCVIGRRESLLSQCFFSPSCAVDFLFFVADNLTFNWPFPSSVSS